MIVLISVAVNVFVCVMGDEVCLCTWGCTMGCRRGLGQTMYMGVKVGGLVGTLRSEVRTENEIVTSKAFLWSWSPVSINQLPISPPSADL